MVKFTEKEAQAYFAERHMELFSYEAGTNQRNWCVRSRNSSFSPRYYKTLSGAVKSYSWDNGGEFERWLIKYRNNCAVAA